MVSRLDDSKIIDLFYERSEQAIIELSQKYGSVFTGNLCIFKWILGILYRDALGSASNIQK